MLDMTIPLSGYTAEDLAKLSISHLRQLLEEEGVCTGRRMLVACVCTDWDTSTDWDT